METNYLKVEGHPSLLKDQRTRAIINDDKKAFNQYKATKKRIMEDKEKISDLESRIQTLEKIMQRLLDDNSIRN